MLWIALPVLLLHALYFYQPQLHQAVNPVLAALLTGLLLSVFFTTLRKPHRIAQAAARNQTFHTIQQQALRLGIVLFALKVDPQLLLSTDPWLFARLVLLVAVVLCSALWLGVRYFRLPKAQVLLLSAGFSFCGTSAIFATQSLQSAAKDSKQDVAASPAQLSQSLALVMLMGLLALAAYNALAFSGWFSPPELAWLVGSTAPEVSQAVAAAGQLGPLAALAVTIKLARVCLLAPFLIGLNRCQHGNSRAPLPWFIIVFVGLLLLQLCLPVPEALRSVAALVSQSCLMLAMIITGLQSRWQDVKQCPLQTVIFALLIMLLLFLLSIVLITY
ncbi:putative sulfate exporter family transporter [Rheinheimera aquimaris]|uniref:putative sulfate exporter family transporter n=2 Tax=Rheinheimera TaxID=67575 RepID=UPI003A974BA5